MKYCDYTVADFLKDEYFVQSVKNPNQETDLFWESWIQNHPEKRDLVRQAKEIIEHVHFNDLSEYEATPEEFEEIFSKILKGEKSVPSKRLAMASKPWWNPAVTRKLAAAFILMMLSAWLYFYLLPVQQDADPPIVKQLIKENPKGQRSIITLTDGTVVHLNANSKLIVHDNFNKNNRHVALEGEAFFDVVKNPESPFTIQCGDMRTTVLGTSFNIHAYPEKNNFQVALVSGKLTVGMKDAGAEVIELKPNERVNYHKDTKTLNKERFTDLDFIAWKDGILQFKDADLSEINERLERWYGVNIILDGKIGIKRRFTGKFENKSLEYVLDGIGYASGFEYKIEGKEVIIKNFK
ncbi:DUF4974 domain-containing protein [Fulvivirgaceae bacterium BMA12]|uniref:DUF4974 domain-containing protein n=1 Tax=Agaribacillus aureus TaxID=3051825 RepID=A0ABT8LCM8_9BACT|nr:DUF4974 domain-containing protein [Fulvivirgaceae bacterium BMA12]